MATNVQADAVQAVDPDGHIQYFLSKVKARSSQSTHEVRRTDVLDFANWLHESPYTDAETVTDATARTIGDYIDSVANDGYAPPTVNRRYDSVRMFYGRLAGEYGVMDDDPFEHIDKKKFSNVWKGPRKNPELAEQIVYVTPEEKERIADHVPTPALRNELIVRLLWQTGVRRGELAEIRLDKVDRDDRSIEVRNLKKNDPDDPTRTVFYQASLDFLLEQWIDGGYRDSFPNGKESPYLFTGERGPAINSDDVGVIVKEAANEAGVNEVMYEDVHGNERWKVTSHALRHGHAVEALKSGIDVRTVQKHLGHSSLDMTMRYLNLIDDDVRDAYQRFGSDD
jgi:integrase/recombinase XerD